MKKRIKHILEQNVDDSYYLSQKALEYFCRAGQRFEDKSVKQSAEPKIVGYTRDKKGEVVKRSLRDISNTVTTFTGSGHNTDMYAAEPKIVASRGRGEFNRQQLEKNESGTSNTLTSVSKDTLSTSTKDNMLAVPELRMEDGCMVDKEGRKYRIRKLTPTECFRLQDVSDEDIEKIRSYRDDETAVICDANGEPIMNMDFDKPSKNARKITITVNGEQREYYSSQLIWKNKGKGISKTAQYKLAGNSICVAPMYHIFRKLFIEKECENQQLELF